MQGEDREGEGDLVGRLKGIDMDILSSTTLSIDRDIRDHNVSGFLICYYNQSCRGQERFAERNLAFTSPYVDEEVLL